VPQAAVDDRFGQEKPERDLRGVHSGFPAAQQHVLRRHAQCRMRALHRWAPRLFHFSNALARVSPLTAGPTSQVAVGSLDRVPAVLLQLIRRLLGPPPCQY